MKNSKSSNSTEALTPAQIQTLFTDLAAELEAQPWFREGAWLCSRHLFPPEPAVPEGMPFQLFKAHWFNAEHHGIHFESYLDFAAAKQQKAWVTLHLLHLPLIPGTDIRRKQLAQRVVDEIRPLIETWPGYRFRAGAYGQQAFAKALNGQSPAFEAELLTELSRLARTVGPVIDQALSELLGEK